MRIATYNLWNADDDRERRLAAASDELRAIKSDFIALQEAPTMAAPDRPLASYFEAETGYRRALHLAYPVDPESGDEPEGLAFLSDVPMRDIRTNWESGASTHNNWAARVTAEISGATIGITNVHLDWERQDTRAIGIVEIIGRLVGDTMADIELLCGDFNEGEDGPVAEFLLGTSWHDASASPKNIGAPLFTLDFAGNPHLRNRVSDRSQRFDRVYLRSAKGRPTPKITASGLFGQRPNNRFNILPSDHYGVFVDLEF